MIAGHLNFDLFIDHRPAGRSYRARVIQSPAGEAVADFSLPFSTDELTDFLWRTNGGVRNLGVAPDEAGAALDPRAFGTLLFAAAFAGPVGQCLRRSLDEAERRGAGLRIRLRLDADVLELAELPWELLFAPELGRFLALSDLTPIVRYIELDRPVQLLRAHLPLAVLAVISNPRGVAPLAVESEWQHLQDALDPLMQRGVIALERLETATLPALQARLRRGPVNLLHFVGHGFFDVQTNTGGLIFENERGEAEVAAAETLGMLLHDHAALRLIFLNACQGAQGGRSDPFAGVAQRLVQQGAPAVLAMQFPVSDAAAITLSQAFYQALADGLPADIALSEARKAIAARGNDREWATPVLFSRSDDNQLFDLRDVLPPPACPYPGMVPFRAEDARFFYGREGEIRHILDHLRRQRLLFVIGPSGSGKSSLIAAGLLPRLEKSRYFPPDYWLVRTMRPLDHPLATLAASLEGDIGQPEQAVAVLLAAHTPAQRLLLVIDQFEEVFSLADKAARQQFMTALQVLRSCQQCALIIALRADFYPDLMNCELWPVDPGQRLEIAVLRGDALRQAIRQPATDVEVDIAEALIERLVADAAEEPGALPMLQETLVLLWERMRRLQISLGDYEQMGEGERSGLAVAVARKADATVAELTPAEQMIAQRIFLRLIQFGEGRRDTRRQLPAADLRSAAEEDQALERTLEHLARNRLLTTSGDEGGARRVDIAHETLITGWPRLQGWLNQRRAAEQTRRRLEEKAAEWVQTDRRGGLLDEYELQEAARWLAGGDAQELGHSQELAHLVQTSRGAIETQARAKRHNRIAAAAAALMIVGLIIGTLLIGNRGQQAQLALQATAAADQAKAATRQAEDAQELAVRATAAAEANARAVANFLVSQGQARINDAPLLGMRFLFEGWRRSDSVNKAVSESIIALEMAKGRFAKIGEDVNSLYVLAQGALALAIRETRPGQLWQAGNGSVETLRARIKAVQDSPDPAMTYVAVRYGDDFLELRRRADGQTVALGADLTAIVYSPDVRAAFMVLAYADRPGELRLTRDTSMQATLAGQVEQAYFSDDPASSFLVVAYTDRAGQLIRPQSGAVIGDLAGQVAGVVFSPDPAATYAVIQYEDHPSELVRTGTGAILTKFGGHVTEVVFSQDAEAAYAVVMYGEIGALSEVDDVSRYRENEPPAELWRTQDGARLAILTNPYAFDYGGIGSVTFTPLPSAAYLRLELVEAYEAEVDPDHGTVTPANSVAHEVYLSTQDGQPVAEEAARENGASDAAGLAPASRSIYQAPAGAGHVIVQPGPTNDPAQLHTAEGTTVILAGPVQGVVFSPSGAYFVPLYASRTYEVRRADGSVAGQLDLGSLRCQLTWLVFSPDERSLALGDVCRWYATVWNQELRRIDGTTIGRLPFEMELDAAAFSPDGRYLLGYVAGQPRLLYSVDNLAPPVLIAPETGWAEFSRTPGSHSFLGLNDGRLALYDARTGAAIGADAESSLSDVADVEVSPGGGHLVVRRRDTSSELWLWDESLQPLATLGIGLSAHHFDAEEARLYMVFTDGRAEILDVNWLEALRSEPLPASVEQWERIFCQGPWRDAGLDEQELGSLAAGVEMLSCAP